MIYNFDERLALSKGRRQETDEATLRLMFPECVGVEKTTEAVDRSGVDYIVMLRRGATVRVDAKTREPGCARYWKDRSPEVALEIWSVMPGGKFGVPDHGKRAGWTLDESKDVDLILFTFDPSDHEYAYVRSLPLLRETFRRYFVRWSRYRRAKQESDKWLPQEQRTLRWESECRFVPLDVVDAAMYETSRIRTALDDPNLLIPQSEPTPIYDQTEIREQP